MTGTHRIWATATVTSCVHSPHSEVGIGGSLLPPAGLDQDRLLCFPRATSNKTGPSRPGVAPLHVGVQTILVNWSGS